MDNVTVYTRPLCIWCILAKRLLKKRGITYQERVVDDAARAVLQAKTGMRTVPQIFFGDELVGGYEALAARLSPSP